MNITRHNCEAAFLDYYEKNLSPVEVAEVLFFLEENPDLKEVFEAYEDIFLEHDKINFPDKEALKKKYSAEELNVILSSEINRTNCEQFFVASAEGVLSGTQAQKLNAFLALHPELQKDFDLFQKCKLPAEKISFEYKNTLKKEPICAENREEYFIRAIDKDLNLTEQKQLASFLHKNPEYKKELEQFKKTILTPEKISFEFKEHLKKRERKPVVIALFSQRTTYYAAAAAVLLLLGLFFFFRNDAPVSYLANNTKQAAVKTETATGNKTSHNPLTEKEQTPTSPKEESVNTEKQQPSANSSVFAVKNPVTPKVKINENVQEEKNIPAPILVQDNTEEKLIANKADVKAPEKADNTTAQNKEEKKDSSSVSNQITGSVVASVQIPKRDNAEYESMRGFINKKVRNVLGINKPTECETASDEITLWDVAMAAKNGVQKIIGTKAIDINKVCDGSGDKVEYVFAAGNFRISRSGSQR